MENVYAKLTKELIQFCGRDRVGLPKEQEVLSRVLGGKVNFEGCEKESLRPVEKCNEESGI